MPEKADIQSCGSAARSAAVALTAPYLAWIAFIGVFEVARAFGLPLPGGWMPCIYAAKSAFCLALIMLLKPWRLAAPAPCLANGDSSRGNVKWILIGAVVGIFVAFLWIMPETLWLFSHCRSASLFYHRWLIMPLGDWPDYFAPSVFPMLPDGASGLTFSPACAGWPLAVTRLLGSAFVISAAEEFFFRSFLYRWLCGRNWRLLPLSGFEAQPFWIVVAVFACEHDRWFLGAVAGIAYGWLTIRSGRVGPSIVAHIVTNFLLGIYVLVFGRYGFW